VSVSDGVMNVYHHSYLCSAPGLRHCMWYSHPDVLTTMTLAASLVMHRDVVHVARMLVVQDRRRDVRREHKLLQPRQKLIRHRNLEKVSNIELQFWFEYTLKSSELYA